MLSLPSLLSVSRLCTSEIILREPSCMSQPQDQRQHAEHGTQGREVNPPKRQAMCTPMGGVIDACARSAFRQCNQ